MPNEHSHNGTCAVLKKKRMLLLYSSIIIFAIIRILETQYSFPSTDIPPFDEYKLQLYMHNQRKALINESSVMMLGQDDDLPQPSQFFHDFFGDEMEWVEKWKEIALSNSSVKDEYLNLFTDPTRGDLLVQGGEVCDTILAFRETNGVKRHVLIAGINENWGAFSDPVPNRTEDWGDWESHFGESGCKMEDLWYYLNHSNVSAIFTTTHQWLDHPKIFSVPLGVSNARRATKEMHKKSMLDRTNLMVLNHSPWEHRTSITNKTIANFNGTIENTYEEYGSNYWEQLRNSKFILCPSGLGWDTYRAWEALVMGTIPILETYYRKDGFYKTFDDLPVLWVDHFDNVTQALLEEAYPKILSKAREYNFAKLTNHWWADFINSYRFSPQRKDRPSSPGQDPKQNTGTVLVKENASAKSDATSHPKPDSDDGIMTETKDMPWMNITGVILSRIHGDPATCVDVIYIADTQFVADQASTVNANWNALSKIVETFSTFNQTCAAYFHLSNEIWNTGLLHPVWGRLPATAIAMSYFDNASYFLYMDSDAILASTKYTPTSMYKALAYDGYGVNATFQNLDPSLIVNKPLTGWLCSQCEQFGLGHGCFNSGALLWRRSEGASLVLKAWWESRLHNKTQNFHQEKAGYFHGWSMDNEYDYGADKMSEQNRLMYIFHNNPDVHRMVWPVPRQISDETNSSSCPGEVDPRHTPCLQNDFEDQATWNSLGSSCFINHHTDAKDQVHKALDMIRHSKPQEKNRKQVPKEVKQRGAKGNKRIKSKSK